MKDIRTEFQLMFCVKVYKNRITCLCLGCVHSWRLNIYIWKVSSIQSFPTLNILKLHPEHIKCVCSQIFAMCLAISMLICWLVQYPCCSHEKWLSIAVVFRAGVTAAHW